MISLRNKLEAKEGSWIRINFMDGTFFVGILRQVGSDYIEIESFEQEFAQFAYSFGVGNPNTPQSPQLNISEHAAYSKHVIPLHLIKFVTLETSSFTEAERKRLSYIAARHTMPEEAYNLPDREI